MDINAVKYFTGLKWLCHKRQEKSFKFIGKKCKPCRSFNYTFITANHNDYNE